MLAKRWTRLSCEIKLLDRSLKQLTERVAVRLLQQFGIVTQTAATLMVTAAAGFPDSLPVTLSTLKVGSASMAPSVSLNTIRDRGAGGKQAAGLAAAYRPGHRRPPGRDCPTLHPRPQWGFEVTEISGVLQRLECGLPDIARSPRPPPPRFPRDCARHHVRS